MPCKCPQIQQEVPIWVWIPPQQVGEPFRESHQCGHQLPVTLQRPLAVSRLLPCATRARTFGSWTHSRLYLDPHPCSEMHVAMANRKGSLEALAERHCQPLVLIHVDCSESMR